MKQIIDKITTAGRHRAFVVKAISFAMVGVINATVNYIMFWLLLRAMEHSAGFALAVEGAGRNFGIGATDARAIAANVIAWVVAVSGSYVMNSYFTFARESGRKLSWRAYFTFAASGILGLIADTTTLLVASRFLPIMLAKIVAIGAGFVVNFSMSNFVVFRARKSPH
jgi:putative flippase GtrA